MQRIWDKDKMNKRGIKIAKSPPTPDKYVKVDFSPFVDKDLVYAITKLNEKGYFTYGCCQGHTYDEEKRCSAFPYIGFVDYYDFKVPPPEKWLKDCAVLEETKRTKSGYCQRGRVLYWNIVRVGKNLSDTIEADRRLTIENINRWVDKL